MPTLPARGREQGESEREDQFSGNPDRGPVGCSRLEFTMANVLSSSVTRTAGAVKLEFVNGREGKIV